MYSLTHVYVYTETDGKENYDYNWDRRIRQTSESSLSHTYPHLNVFLLASLRKKFAQFKDAKKGGVQKAIPISPPVKAAHSLLLSCYIVHVLTSMYFLALCNKARVVSLSGKGTCCLKTSRQSRNCARLQFKKEKNKIIVGSAREGAKERERKGDLMWNSLSLLLWIQFLNSFGIRHENQNSWWQVQVQFSKSTHTHTHIHSIHSFMQ